MKYIFGVNRASGSRRHEGECFVTASADAELNARMQRVIRKESELISKMISPLPSWLEFVKWLGGAAGICGLYLVLACLLHINENTVPLATAYRNAPWLFWAAGAGAAAFMILWGIGTVRKKKANESGALDEAAKEAEAIEALLSSRLSIPKDAAMIDMIEFDYRPVKNGIESNSRSALSEMPVWREGAALKIARLNLEDGASVLTIPIDDIKSLRVLRMAFNIDEWNKEADPSIKRFRRFGVVTGKYGFSGLSFCCALETEKNGESYRLLFPAYELEKMANITGLAAPELPDKKGLSNASGEKEKLRPIYYWKIPEGSDVASWFKPGSDLEFASKHPKAYVVLLILGIAALIAPMLIYMLAMGPKYFNNWKFGVGGIVGGLSFGVGLFNLVAAWLHQYLGHKVTIIAFALGILLMALPFIV